MSIETERVQMSKKIPPKACADAVELLIKTHPEDITIYERDKGGVVVITSEPDYMEALMTLVDGIDKIVAILNEKKIQEELEYNPFGNSSTIPEA